MQAWKRSGAGIAAGILLAGLMSATEAQLTGVPAAETVNPMPGGPGLGGKPSALPAVLIVPGEISAERISQDGCWAQFYEDAHFKGIQLNILGPVELRTMEGPFGAEWKDLDSAVVGSRARVTLFDDEDFEDRSLVLEPGSHVPDFDALWGLGWLGWFTEVESLRVLCVPYR